MKKIISITSSLLLAFIMIVASIMNVNAVNDTISIGQARKVEHNYIANVTFSYKVTTDGRYLYCLDLHRDTASNVQAKLVSNSSYIDGGLLYILKNGYPEKSITGDTDKDYYITQSAVWWYLDSTHGAHNLGNGFKETGSDPYNIRQYVRNLVNEGIAHRNDSVEPAETKLTIGVVNNNSLTLQNGYYTSNDIKATSISNIGSYTVTLGNALNGTKIVLDGREFAYSGAFNVGANSSFKIKVPAASVTTTSANITINASATGNTEYRAYEYQPVNTKMQNVALIEKTNRKVESSTNVTIDSSRVRVTKVDSKTKAPVEGAVLTVKDANGKAIDTWTTTKDTHIIRNLADGVYTVEEVKAPNGYALSNKKVTVTIDSKHKDVAVTFENEELSSMSITKIDADTKKPLAGAVLVLKDSNGKEISKWTTTINAHIIKNLTPGTYTVEEVQAPKGYILNKKITTVKVTEDVKTYKVTIENKHKNVVININKIDQETKKPLAGAVLVVKDSTGKVVSRFTTTEEPHVLTDIANGKYTVEEESAPAGYIRSTEVVTFTVDDEHQSHQITIVNAKEVYVPNTGSESIIMFLVGAIIIGIGLEYVLKNVKA